MGGVLSSCSKSRLKTWRLCRNGDRQWWDSFNVNKEFEEACDVDVGAAIHHRRRGYRGGSSRSAVDPSSNLSIGVFITAEAENPWQADDTCDTVHGKHGWVEVIEREGGGFIIGPAKREFERSRRRCWTKEDAGIGE